MPDGDHSEKLTGSKAGADMVQPMAGAQARALRIQTIIMQAKSGMTRVELEEYADELEREGLFKDMTDES